MKRILIAFLLLVFTLTLTANQQIIDPMKPILNFLKTITPPRLVREGLALYGVTEFSGSQSNPIILNWAKETKTNSDNWYNTDSIPWCGLYMAVIAQRAKWEVVNLPLRALSWSTFGNPIPLDKGCLGDVCVFTRKGGGHVGVTIAYSTDKKYIYVLGGNQADKVNIAKIATSRLHAIRRPPYKVPPDTVKQYFFDIKGNVSTNEQ